MQFRYLKKMLGGGKIRSERNRVRRKKCFKYQGLKIFKYLKLEKSNHLYLIVRFLRLHIFKKIIQ